MGKKKARSKGGQREKRAQKAREKAKKKRVQRTPVGTREPRSWNLDPFNRTGSSLPGGSSRLRGPAPSPPEPPVPPPDTVRAVYEFTVVLDSMPEGTVTIGLSSDNTDEGTVAPNEVTFTSDNWYQPQTVTVTGQDDQEPASVGNV